MVIYFSHSRNFNYRQDLYLPIQQSDIQKRYDLIFPHEKSEAPYPVKNLIQSNKIDLVIAEVSYPATGQGIELGWANMCQIPVIAFYKPNSTLSQSLKNICLKLLQYENSQYLIIKLTNTLKHYNGIKTAA